MRVLVVAPHYNTFIKGWAEALASHVESVEVLVHHNRFADLLKSLPFGGYLNYVRRFTSDKLLNLEGKPENVRVHLISKFYFPPSYRNEKVGDIFLRKMLSLLERRHIEGDVVHAHFTWPPGYIGAKLKESLEAKLVVTGHGYDVYDLPFRSNALREKIRYALSRADAVTTVSKPNCRILIDRLGLSERRVHLIPNGVSKIFYPMDREEVRSKLGIPTEEKVVLSAGSLIEVKGHEYLIKALASLKNSLEFRTFIIGQGHLMSKIRRLIRETGLENRVRLVGPRPYSEMPLWMNAADILAIPSLAEGLPTVMLEALACGTPIVGTKVGGIPDVLDGECGLLVEPGDVRALSQAIEEALTRGWDKGKIARKGGEFYWDRITERYMRLYWDILAG